MEKETTIYSWAFVAGKALIKQFEKLYGTERAEKKMETLLLTLRSEIIPDRFRRALIDALIEVTPQVGIPEKIKVEKPWRIDEFYRYSTAILSGLFDSLNAWKGEKEEKGEEGG